MPKQPRNELFFALNYHQNGYSFDIASHIPPEAAIAPQIKNDNWRQIL